MRTKNRSKNSLVIAFPNLCVNIVETVDIIHDFYGYDEGTTDICLPLHKGDG